MDYQNKYYEVKSELEALKRANENRDFDSLARSALSFICHKKMHEEWVKWLVAEIDQRCRLAPSTDERIAR